MKKLQRAFVVLLVAVTALSVSAQEFSSGDLMFKIYSPNAWVTGLTATAKGKSNLTVTIPGKVTYNGTTYRVNGIDANAFTNATNITGVDMRFGVATIEGSAFSGCTGISYVRLPSSIRYIYSSAFTGCSSLKYVYLAGFDYPYSVTATSFPSNSGMTLRISPQSKRTPANYKERTGFTQFATVEYSIYAYDEYMNDGGMYAFGYPDSQGPTEVRSGKLVGYNTNGSNTSSGTIYKPTNATYNLSNAVSFSIDTICSNAFQGQTTLKTIDLTNASNIKYIAYQDANTGIQNVTKMVLPKSNFSFSTATFVNFTSLAAFELAAGSTSYSIHDGSLYNNSKTNLYRVPPAKSGAMSYPKTLTSLWSSCHANCGSITSAYLPYGVKTINWGAFRSCGNLKSVRIPSSVTTLSENRVFLNIHKDAFVYVNMQTPPTITASSYFGTNSNIDLYVPYGCESAYAAAGWTGFYGVNRNAQAYDSDTDGVPITVTSTASTTGNDGKTYNGRAKVVWGVGTRALEANTTVNIPSSITINGKSYAVTMIGEEAFNNNTNDFKVTGCANVDTVGDFAFQDQPITSYPFTHGLERLMQRAFDGTKLTGTISLPYGIKYLGAYALGNGKYTRLIIPSSLANINGNFCAGTSTLTELVMNLGTKTFYGWTGWNLTGVPNTCAIRVPTGVVNQYKTNSALSSRASYITAGAYDFAYSNSYTGIYFLTVVSNASTTYNGTTYAGKAKYVYHPNIQNYTPSGNGSYGFSISEEDRTVSGDIRKYLITEIGDSLLYGSKFTSGNIPSAVTRIGQSAFSRSAYAVNNLTLPSGLTFIGHDAFYDSKITGEVKVPATVTTLEGWALCASTLSSIYFPDMTVPTMGSTVWSESIGTVWVPNNRANTYLTRANNWGTSYANKLAVWIKPTASSTMFSSVVPTNLSSSNITAYYASNYDRNNTGKEVTLTRATQAPQNTGLLLTGLTANQEYRIIRATNTVTAPMTNYFIGNPSESVNVYNQTVGFRWDASNQKFVKPTSAYTLSAGQAYLKLSSAEASGKSEVYTDLWPKTDTGGIKGDYNGDGKVDITDVNAAINIMLGKVSYNANCDMNSDNKIDITDVNAIINKMLGK